MTTAVVWIEQSVVLTVHAELMARHGGRLGVRDENALGSALARPRHLFAYERPTVHHLAAAYAFGLARNHPFVDGNKRVSLVTTELLLSENGFRLTATNDTAVEVWLEVASGRMEEPSITAWLQRHSKPA